MICFARISFALRSLWPHVSVAWQERCLQQPPQAAQILLAAASLEAGSKAAHPAQVTTLTCTTKAGGSGVQKGQEWRTKLDVTQGQKPRIKREIRRQDRLSSAGGRVSSTGP